MYLGPNITLFVLINKTGWGAVSYKHDDTILDKLIRNLSRRFYLGRDHLNTMKE